MVLRLILQYLAAGIGTATFAGLFHAPSSIYRRCFMIGGTGWLIYYLLAEVFAVDAFLATILSAVFITLDARVSAVIGATPVTAYLIPAVFPLIPGVKLYQMIFCLIDKNGRQGGEYFHSAASVLIAIVFGLLLAFEIPNSVFLAIGKKIRSHCNLKA